MADTPVQTLIAAGIPLYLHGFSAIDAYLGRNSAAAVHLLCATDLAGLARLFETLRYPGVAFADAAVDSNGKTWYFRCLDADLRNYRSPSFRFLDFFQDCHTRRFYDPHDIYPLLRHMRDGIAHDEPVQWWKLSGAEHESRYALIDGAMILARYFPETGSKTIRVMAAECNGQNSGGRPSLPGMEEQRLLLIGLLDGANPAAGFELLKNSGFIAAHWPELAELDDVDHAKEFHPEGNVWKHTMETLRYRKSSGSGFDVRLSLGLLLHDLGKPLSESAGRGQGRRRFDGHAELGERLARRFLERLGFDTTLIGDVCYLVRNHMLPAALPRLPLVRTGGIMESPLFPLLLELYRCDESSSFKGLDGYYQSSAAYKAYLKYRRNPYRQADGKKLRREERK